MGGFGSGRHRWNRTGRVEDCRFLDVNEMHRASVFVAGTSCEWNWTRNGKRVAGVAIRVEPTRLQKIREPREFLAILRGKA